MAPTAGRRIAAASTRRARATTSGSASPGSYCLAVLPLYRLEGICAGKAEDRKGQEARQRKKALPAVSNSNHGEPGETQNRVPFPDTPISPWLTLICLHAVTSCNCTTSPRASNSGLSLRQPRRTMSADWLGIRTRISVGVPRCATKCAKFAEIFSSFSAGWQRKTPENALFSGVLSAWCREGDSNPQALSGTWSLAMRVCQFHHLGEQGRLYRLRGRPCKPTDQPEAGCPRSSCPTLWSSRSHSLGCGWGAYPPDEGWGTGAPKPPAEEWKNPIVLKDGVGSISGLGL